MINQISWWTSCCNNKSWFTHNVLMPLGLTAPASAADAGI